MEAATPLRTARVKAHGDRVAIDGLTVADLTLAELVRERESAGEDPVALVEDALEIGARVLDREQAGANAEFVKAEFEKAARELNGEVSERARAVTEEFTRQLETAFGPESGHVTKALERHFGDASSEAVQHRVRELVNDVMARSREDLLKQFSSADGNNPLADFKASTLRALGDAGRRQEAGLKAMEQRMTALQVELERLRGEKEAAEQVAEERERGTAKGRSYEELVWEAIDEISAALGDESEAVGDTAGAGGKRGDVVVDLDAAYGPSRGRLVFEAKDSRLPKPEALRQLDGALAQRSAHYAVLVVPSAEELPARTHELREIGGDKLFVVYDPQDGSTAALRLAYSLARARTLMSRGDAENLDLAALEDAVTRALASLGEARKIKQQLTGAKTSIDGARALVDTLEAAVREQLEQVQRLVAGAATAADAAD